MRITHITVSVGGGAGISAFRLHEGLRKRPDVDSCIVQRFHIEDRIFAEKHNVNVAPIGRSLITRFRKKYNIHPEHFNGVSLEGYPKNYEVATFANTSYRLEDLPQIKDADIIHLHWIADFINFPTFFPKVKQPIVWTLHDMNPFQGIFHYEDDQAQNQDNLAEIDRKVLCQKIESLHKKKNIFVVAPSQWMKNKSEHSPALGCYSHYLIPYGLDLSLYPSVNRDEAKDALGLNNGLPTLMTIAQDINLKRKGADLFYNAIETLDREINVVTVGGAKKEINNKKIRHTHFNFISDIAELNKIYSAADMTIVSSREDNLPNTMLESFMNGTPVMSFSNGGMAEHISTGDTGILVKETNSNVLAKNIVDFLDNKYTFDRDRIREYAITNFAEQNQISSYIELYKNILNV